MSNKIDYQSVLNPAQLEAVMTLDGPILVIAGAGSGKTRTLVYRVAHLVEKGTQPENVLLLTFTRKAAGEMMERAAELSDERCRHISGGTFHSLAYRVLRQYADLLGFSQSFTIIDRSDMEEAIQSIVRDMQVEKGSVRFPKRSTLATIVSKSANLQCSIEDLVSEEYAHFLEYAPELQRLQNLYGAYKKENQLTDYDDLILLFRRLLSENKEVRLKLAEQYRYVMVDEYQDTNAIQADIVKWLAESHRNIMVVGDDSQSIYSFRGANYKNMFDFPALFPGAKTIKLEENYRSTQPILTFTNALMEQAHEKYTKCLFTRRADGELPKVVDTKTEPEQAMFICRVIKEHLNHGGGIQDLAVLFRAGYHSFELELELTRQSIPYVKYGGFKFMESAHIKDAIAHLRVVVNRDDNLSWGRILKLLKGIGQEKSRSIIKWMRGNGVHPWTVAQWPEAGKGQAGLKKLSELMKKISTGNVSSAESVEMVIEYYEPILEEKFDDYPRRRKDLEHLVPMAGRYKGLKSFLDDLMLEPPTSQADLASEEGARLTLSTVHSAKGLEWSKVFVIWVVDGYFPPMKATAKPEAMEEELRLMYVAATRAKDRLYLCYPSMEANRSRAAWGGGYATNGGELTSFIRAIPNGVVEYGSSGSSGGFPRMGEHMDRPRVDRSHNDGPRLQKAVEPRHLKAIGSRHGGLRTGDRVSHPAFGHGVIAKFIAGEKVEVIFAGVGRKLLHLEYTTLEKR